MSNKPTERLRSLTIAGLGALTFNPASASGLFIQAGNATLVLRMPSEATLELLDAATGAVLFKMDVTPKPARKRGIARWLFTGFFR